MPTDSVEKRPFRVVQTKRGDPEVAKLLFLRTSKFASVANALEKGLSQQNRAVSVIQCQAADSLLGGGRQSLTSRVSRRKKRSDDGSGASCGRMHPHVWRILNLIG